MSKPYSRHPDDVFRPQKRHAVFTGGIASDRVTLAVEASRLAYFRFENPKDPDPESDPRQTPEPSPKQKLEESLGSIGFKKFAYFVDSVPSLAEFVSTHGPLRMPRESLQTLLAVGDISWPDVSLPGVLGVAARKLAETLAQRVSDVLPALPAENRLSSFTHTQAFAAFRPEDRLALLAFRGSQADTLCDVLLDGQFLQVHADGWTGALHHGFARGATAIWPQVEAWLRDEGGMRRQLLVSGHSLGAALATLIAMRAPRAELPTQLVTIGSPRVGNQAFAKAFNASGVEAIRIVNGIDAVTHVPPANVPLLTYCHVGKEVFIDQAGDRSAQATADNKPVAVSLADKRRFITTGLKPDELLPRWLADHAPVNYLRAYWP